MTLGIVILLGVLCLFLSAALSGMETGLYGLKRVRLEIQAAEGNSRARRLQGLLARPERVVATILVLNNIVNYGVAWCSSTLFKQSGTEGMDEVTVELLAALYLTPVLFLVGELLPKTLFMRYPARLVAVVLPLYQGLAVMVRPIITPLLRLIGESGSETVAKEGALFARSGVIDVLTEGDEAESLDPAQRHAVAQVLALKALTAADAMLAWKGVAKVAPDADREAVLQATARFGRKRLMLIEDDQDRYVNAMDAFFLEGESHTFRACEVAHQVPQVRPDKSLIAVLELLQRKRCPIAVVRDDRGQRLGLLTMSEVSGSILGLAEVREP